MKIILLVVLLAGVMICQAQIVDSSIAKAARYFREAELAGAKPPIWGKKIIGPTLLVDPQTRTTYANSSDSGGILQPVAEIYTGVLPKDILLANTAISWQGKKWSVLLWPLPEDKEERINLILHESFHRIQAELGLPERSPTADHLSRIDGRVLFLLELQALKRALLLPVNQRHEAITHALHFRKQRQHLFPVTFLHEEALEMSEGLAEYTGVILGRQQDAVLPHLLLEIDRAAQRKSLIRSCAYITGPVYGYLLYQKFPGWTMVLDTATNFASLMTQYYPIDSRKKWKRRVLEKKYYGDTILVSEKRKEQLRQQTTDRYVDLFTKQAVLEILLDKMNIVFNPNTLFDLGKYGTVYPTAEIRDVWGQLTVSSNGMLMKDWKVVRVPAEKIRIDGKIIEGDGWKIVLHESWNISRKEENRFQLIRNNRLTNE